MYIWMFVLFYLSKNGVHFPIECGVVRFPLAILCCFTFICFLVCLFVCWFWLNLFIDLRMGHKTYSRYLLPSHREWNYFFLYIELPLRVYCIVTDFAAVSAPFSSSLVVKLPMRPERGIPTQHLNVALVVDDQPKCPVS